MIIIWLPSILYPSTNTTNSTHVPAHQLQINNFCKQDWIIGSKVVPQIPVLHKLLQSNLKHHNLTTPGDLKSLQQGKGGPINNVQWHTKGTYQTQRKHTPTFQCPWLDNLPPSAMSRCQGKLHKNCQCTSLHVGSFCQSVRSLNPPQMLCKPKPSYVPMGLRTSRDSPNLNLTVATPGHLSPPLWLCTPFTILSNQRQQDGHLVT